MFTKIWVFSIKSLPESRIFVYEDELYKQVVPKSRAERTSLKEKIRIIFFNDIMMLAKYKNNTLESIKKYPMKINLECCSDESTGTALKFGSIIYFTRTKTNLEKIIKVHHLLSQTDINQKQNKS